MSDTLRLALALYAGAMVHAFIGVIIQTLIEKMSGGRIAWEVIQSVLLWPLYTIRLLLKAMSGEPLLSVDEKGAKLTGFQVDCALCGTLCEGGTLRSSIEIVHPQTGKCERDGKLCMLPLHCPHHDHEQGDFD